MLEARKHLRRKTSNRILKHISSFKKKKKLNFTHLIYALSSYHRIRFKIFYFFEWNPLFQFLTSTIDEKEVNFNKVLMFQLFRVSTMYVWREEKKK
jgi:hypothetical protein